MSRGLGRTKPGSKVKYAQKIGLHAFFMLIQTLKE